MDALAVLQRLGSGRLMEELHKALTQTAAEVVETGNPGTVTLALRITTKGQGNPMVVIDESVGRTPPKKAAQGAILWALEGQLHSQDPRQARMEFRAVDTETAIRDVGWTGNWPAPGSEEVDAYRHEVRDAEEVS